MLCWLTIGTRALGSKVVLRDVNNLCSFDRICSSGNLYGGCLCIFASRGQKTSQQNKRAAAGAVVSQSAVLLGIKGHLFATLPAISSRNQISISAAAVCAIRLVCSKNTFFFAAATAA